jgi:hypothetical protein
MTHMTDSMSAEVLRRAAARPHASQRLLRVADAVREGKFTWEDIAGGQCTHPLAGTLLTPKARETLWPVLDRVAAELEAEKAPEPEPAPAPRRRRVDDDDGGYDFSAALDRV